MTLLDPCAMDKRGYFFLAQKENLLAPYDRIGLSSIPCLALDSRNLFWFSLLLFDFVLLLLLLLNAFTRFLNLQFLEFTGLQS